MAGAESNALALASDSGLSGKQLVGRLRYVRQKLEVSAWYSNVPRLLEAFLHV